MPHRTAAPDPFSVLSKATRVTRQPSPVLRRGWMTDGDQRLTRHMIIARTLQASHGYPAQPATWSYRVSPPVRPDVCSAARCLSTRHVPRRAASGRFRGSCGFLRVPGGVYRVFADLSRGAAVPSSSGRFRRPRRGRAGRSARKWGVPPGRSGGRARR